MHHWHSCLHNIPHLTKFKVLWDLFPTYSNSYNEHPCNPHWELKHITMKYGYGCFFFFLVVFISGWCLLLGRKAMTNLDNMLKSRDITLPAKVHLVKAMVFPVVMYGCESWTVKKAKQWRIDASELWYWRRLLRVSWTARRSNQSILKEISPKYPLEGLMLKLKL